MKFLKIILVLTAFISLSACNSKNPEIQETTAYTQPAVTESETQQIQENIYTRYPQLSQYDIFSEYYERAEEIVNSMTAQQKAGQIFWISCPDNETDANDVVSRYNPGGYVLSAENFENSKPYSMKSMLENFQSASAFRMAIACEEEGGDFVCASKYTQFRLNPFYSPQTLYQIGGFDEIFNDTRSKALFLKELGINTNLAPVADVSENPTDYIYSRTLGKNADDTGQYVKLSVRAYNEAGVTCVLKHFPGYGSNINTSHTISVDEREYSEFTSKDFIPFTEGIKANAPCIMISHNTVVSMDVANPASLSSSVHDILRTRLGFTGIIMTDDLADSAEYDKIGEVDVFLNAINAGNDILYTSEYEEGLPAVVKAVQTGKISEQRINTSVIRIIAWKLKYGIIT